ncbi:MAG: ThiF family adenylyltransferase [bacterium]
MKQNERFARLKLVLGEEVVSRLSRSYVTVVGLGGVGGIAAEALVRSGIGHLRIIDTDTVRITDINRQIIALDSTLGRNKVDAAKERFLEINPFLDISAIKAFFHVETAQELLHPKPDYVIDAIDAVLPKIELLTYCHSHAIPVVSAMGAAYKTSFNHISVADISATTVCRLARIVRRRLGRRGIKQGITCVFSTEMNRRVSELQTNSNSDISRGRPRPPLGSYSPIIQIFGLLAADCVIKSIAEK